MKAVKILYIAFALVLLWQCTEPYTPDLDETYTRLTVEGYLTDSPEKQYVRLAYSDAYLANTEPRPVEDAIVTVYMYTDTSQNPIDTIGYVEGEEAGIYLPPTGFTGTPEHFYKMLIEHVDIDEDGHYEQYEAVDYMPKPIGEEGWDSISLRYLATSQFDFWQLRLWAWEPHETNWYVFHKFKNGVMLSDTISLWNASDDYMFNGNYTSGVDVQSLSNYDSIEWPELEDTFELEMWNISEQYYNHIIQTQEVIGYQNPLFSGPPSNVITNLSEGAVGFFATYSTNRDTTICTFIPEEALKNREEGE